MLLRNPCRGKITVGRKIEHRPFKERAVMLFARRSRAFGVGMTDAISGWPLSRFARQTSFLGGHHDLGNGDGVAFHLTGKHHGVPGVHLEQRAVLVGDLVHFALTDENIFAAALDASQRAIPVGHSWMRGSHFCVARPAHTVADLPVPGLISCE